MGEAAPVFGSLELTVELRDKDKHLSAPPPLEVPLATVSSGSGESSASVRCDSVIVSDRKVGRIRGNSKTKVKAKHRKLRLKTSFHVNAEGSTPRHGSSFFPPSMSGSLSCNLYSAVGIYTLL